MCNIDIRRSSYKSRRATDDLHPLLQVVSVVTYRVLTRCQARYPQPALQFRRWLTLATFLTQYLAPLAVTAVAYTGVARQVGPSAPPLSR